MQAFFVAVYRLSLDAQKVAVKRFGEVADVGFRRVETATARRVFGVGAQHCQERVAGVAGYLQVAAFVHVAVVVNPFAGDASPMQAQRRVPIVRRGGLGALL